MKYFLSLILLAFFQVQQGNDTNVTGQYRLKYSPKTHTSSGWDIHSVILEELLTLREDSIFVIERIRPQGGFEVLPQTGHWQIKNNVLVLTGDRYPRFFEKAAHGLREPNCERAELRNVLWRKED